MMAKDKDTNKGKTKGKPENSDGGDDARVAKNASNDLPTILEPSVNKEGVVKPTTSIREDTVIERDNTRIPKMGERSDFMKKMIREALAELKNATQFDECQEFDLAKENRKRTAEDMLFPDEADQSSHPKKGRQDGAKRRQEGAKHMISDSEDENDVYAVDDTVDDEQIDSWLNSGDEEEGEIDEVDGDWLEELAGNFMEQDLTGPPVADNLAKIVENFVKKRLEQDKVKDLCEKILKPSNTPTVTSPRVNPQVWMRMKTESRNRDVKLGKVGEKIAKTVIHTVRLVDAMVKLKDKIKETDTKKEVKNLAKMALEAVQIGAIALQDLSQRRRQEMKFNLNQTYRLLCNPPEEESEWLFGTNLHDRVKEMTEARRLGTQVGIYQKNFLGRGRGQNRYRGQASRGRGTNQTRGRGRGNKYPGYNYKGYQEQLSQGHAGQKK